MANKIDEIHDEAFENLDALTDLWVAYYYFILYLEGLFSNVWIYLFRNLGENTFSKFPTKGLQNIVHLKTHNNPNLVEFPGKVYQSDE